MLCRATVLFCFIWELCFLSKYCRTGRVMSRKIWAVSSILLVCLHSSEQVMLSSCGLLFPPGAVVINAGSQVPEDQAFKLLALDKPCMWSWTENLFQIYSNDDNFSLLVFISSSNYMTFFFVVVSEVFSICLSMGVSVCTLFPQLSVSRNSI